MVLLALALGACAPRHQAVELRFASTTPDGVHRLQFYVHDIVLLGSDGRDYAVSLANDAPWQSERVALIDLSPDRSPSAAMGRSPSAASAGAQERPPAGSRHTSIKAEAPQRAYTGVRFAVGVPFDLNHANPLTAAAPLNRGELFWNWQSGYKFVRLDLSETHHEAAFHLGSTGCSSASALRPPAQPCAQPNVIRVALTGFDPLTQPIEVRVADIVAALHETASSACTGDYSQPMCSRAFATTGLDARSGVCARVDGTACSAQRLFFAPSVRHDSTEDQDER